MGGTHLSPRPLCFRVLMAEPYFFGDVVLERRGWEPGARAGACAGLGVSDEHRAGS